MYTFDKDEKRRRSLAYLYLSNMTTSSILISQHAGANGIDESKSSRKDVAGPRLS